jgi:hypothetical protein
MTREDIIGMAREAGIDSMPADHNYRSSYYAGTSDEIERFAALVAAAEREACAKIAENGNFLHDDSPEAKFGKACAAAIRARSQK